MPHSCLLYSASKSDRDLRHLFFSKLKKKKKKQKNKTQKTPKILKGEVYCLRTESNSENTTEIPKQISLPQAILISRAKEEWGTEADSHSPQRLQVGTGK